MSTLIVIFQFSFGLVLAPVDYAIFNYSGVHFFHIVIEKTYFNKIITNVQEP